MLDAVNLAVGLLAILLSITSIIISVTYSSKATSTLEKVKDKAENIEKDVRNRLDDLIKRAAPSEQERALSAVLPDLLKELLANPDMMKFVLEKAMEQGKQSSE